MVHGAIGNDWSMALIAFVDQRSKAEAGYIRAYHGADVYLGQKRNRPEARARRN